MIVHHELIAKTELVNIVHIQAYANKHINLNGDEGQIVVDFDRSEIYSHSEEAINKINVDPIQIECDRVAARISIYEPTESMIIDMDNNLMFTQGSSEIETPGSYSSGAAIALAVIAIVTAVALILFYFIWYWKSRLGGLTLI
ncbi:MAG: hypothetical protein EZS28_009386 [Streblomastix strix]|uniref:Uncharacterized protein n=1 Tax=Streblomastix strix TaxID=222440 RepID=A0A5J4WJW1_9EUKA|nr:MAG: hypothetical protein EZS28_009386 [Streblomastix strix]